MSQKSDGRYSLRDIAKAFGMSLLRVHFTLKSILKMRSSSARWIPEILTDAKNGYGYKPLNNCKKCFPNLIEDNLRILSQVTKHLLTIFNQEDKFETRFG